MLECAGGRIYTGYTTDILRRYQMHLAGRGSRFTRSFPPKRMLIAWSFESGRSLAHRLECKIKSLSRDEKIALMVHPDRLQGLLKDETMPYLSPIFF